MHDASLVGRFLFAICKLRCLFFLNLLHDYALMAKMLLCTVI